MNCYKKYSSWFWLSIGIGAIVLYLYDWYKYPGILHSEVPGDIANFMGGGMQGLSDMVHKVFNLCMIEDGTYRPRIGAFMIQYYDIKWWCKLNEMSSWGGHWPMILPATCIYVLGVVIWLKGIVKILVLSIAFGVGACLLFLPHYVTATFLFLRTAN